MAKRGSKPGQRAHWNAVEQRDGFERAQAGEPAPRPAWAEQELNERVLATFLKRLKALEDRVSRLEGRDTDAPERSRG